MDFEHIIGSPENGIPEGYTFDQTEDEILLTFPLPPNVGLDGVEVHLDGDAIFAGVAHQQPAICGILLDSVHKPTHTCEHGICRIRLQKVEAKPWELLIDGPSQLGIDAKSLFMLGVRTESSGFPREAWYYFKQAADKGYVHAKLLVADSLLNDTNPYHIPKDQNEGIKVLQSIPEERMRPPIRVMLSHALIDNGRTADGKAVLLKAAEESRDARKELVKVLARIPDSTGENLRERVHHLEVLAESNDVESLQELAKCYATGKGCQKDKARARELVHRAHKLDPTIPDAVESSGIGTNLAVAAGISAVFIGAALTIWHLKANNKL